MMEAAKSELTELNNAGTSYLSKGQFADAIDCFTVGLRVTREMLQYEQESITQSLQDETHEDDDFMTVELELGADSDSAEFFHQFQALSVVDQQNTDLIFRQPIVLSGENSLSYTLNAYSFLTVFNMALAHHLSALSKEDARGCQFQAALQLYELAYSLQMQDDAGVTALHACAIINNIGQIQRKLKNEETATRCFEHLLSMLMVVIGSGDGNDQVCRSFAPFFYAVQPYILKTAASAPAA